MQVDTSEASVRSQFVTLLPCDTVLTAGMQPTNTSANVSQGPLLGFNLVH